MKRGTQKQLEDYLTINRVFLGQENQYISVEVGIKRLNSIINSTDPRSILHKRCEELLHGIIVNNVHTTNTNSKEGQSVIDFAGGASYKSAN